MRRLPAILALSAALAAEAGAAQLYSKLGIVAAVRELGRLEAMNDWIDRAGYRDEWLACQVFSDGYPAFAAITNAVVASGLATAGELAAVLAAARADDALGRLVALVESDQGLRERYHGGRFGQYVLTNEAGRIVRVDLYRDGTAWTNSASSPVRTPPDPEARRRAEEEAEAAVAAWEAANLPPDLAALRAAQRARGRANAAAAEEGRP